MIFVTLACVLLAVLFALGLAGSGALVTSTVVAWVLVAAMLVWGLVSREWDSEGLSRNDTLKALGLAAAFIGAGVAIRAVWANATFVDLALMQIHSDEHFGARIQAVGYALLSGLLGITAR